MTGLEVTATLKINKNKQKTILLEIMFLGNAHKNCLENNW
jgi:hypothetical protein